MPVQTLQPSCLDSTDPPFYPLSPDSSALSHSHVFVPAARSSPSTLFLLRISCYLLKFYSSFSPQMKPHLPSEAFPDSPQEEFVSLFSVPVALIHTSFVKRISRLKLHLFLDLFPPAVL